MKKIETAKEFNARTASPGMRWRTESGKERETGFVVSEGNRTAWLSNYRKALKYEFAQEIPSAANGERYDQNS